jgi:hypothetical protein
MNNPYEDMPSCEEHACDLPGCSEPWAWEPDGQTNGPRRLRLCEAHADEWLKAERAHNAEREEVAGREMVLRMSDLFSLARASDGRVKNRRIKRAG